MVHGLAALRDLLRQSVAVSGITGIALTKLDVLDGFEEIQVCTGYRLNGEHIQRSRLRIETRMRLLGKWLPKVYGDKMALTDGDGKPLQAAAPVFHVTVKGG